LALAYCLVLFPNTFVMPRVWRPALLLSCALASAQRLRAQSGDVRPDSSRTVTWVAVGRRDAPYRLDVDETRITHDSTGAVDEIFARVQYDTPRPTPEGYLAAWLEVHLVVNCVRGSYVLLGAQAFTMAGRAVHEEPAGARLPEWMSPDATSLPGAAVTGYCRTFHPESYDWRRADSGRD
jgi:hypothetical protein